MRADAHATHQAVITALDVLGRLGFTEVSIATVKDDGGAALNDTGAATTPIARRTRRASTGGCSATCARTAARSHSACWAA